MVCSGSVSTISSSYRELLKSPHTVPQVSLPQGIAASKNYKSATIFLECSSQAQFNICKRTRRLCHFAVRQLKEQFDDSVKFGACSVEQLHAGVQMVDIQWTIHVWKSYIYLHCSLKWSNCKLACILYEYNYYGWSGRSGHGTLGW